MSELLKPEQVHDHGKLMLAFIMVWAYFSFSQWLIIWAGNLPEEITWYMRRLQWRLGVCGPVPGLFHFAVPFALLISRPFKRDITRLVWLALWILLMRYVDLFWLIEPNFSADFQLTWRTSWSRSRWEDCGWRISSVISARCHWSRPMTFLRSKFWNRRTSRWSSNT